MLTIMQGRQSECVPEALQVLIAVSEAGEICIIFDAGGSLRHTVAELPEAHV